MLTFPHFWRPVWRKRLRFVTIQPIIPTSRRIRCIFVSSSSELWSLFKNSRSKLKNQKPIAVDVHYQAYPMATSLMQIQSGQRVPLSSAFFDTRIKIIGRKFLGGSLGGHFFLTLKPNVHKTAQNIFFHTWIRINKLFQFWFQSSKLLKSFHQLKGHGNETDFLGFLQKLVPHESLTLTFEMFRFWLRIRGDIRIWKTTPPYH